MTKIQSNGIVFQLKEDATGGAICDGLFINFVILDEKLKEDILKFRKEGFNITGDFEFENFYNQGKAAIYKMTSAMKLLNKQKPERK